MQRVVRTDAQRVRDGAADGAPMADDDHVAARMGFRQFFHRRADTGDELLHAFAAGRFFQAAEGPERVRRMGQLDGQFMVRQPLPFAEGLLDQPGLYPKLG